MKSPEYILSELPAIKLFQKLGYEYYDGALRDKKDLMQQLLTGKMRIKTN